MTEFAIVGYSRSGTTAFTHMLNTHREVYAAREIFHPNSKEFESFNIFFHRSAVASDGRTDLDLRAEAFDRYVEALAEKTGKANVGYNVKYVSLHQLDGTWRGLSDPPGIFGVFRRRNVKVFHLLRDNIFDAVISNLVAQRTGIWHKQMGEDYEPDPIRLDPDAAVNMMRVCATERDLFRRYAAQLQVEEIRYEAMFQGDAFSGDLTERVAGVLGVDDSFSRQPKLDRISKIAYASLVTNYHDVLAAVRDAGLLET